MKIGLVSPKRGKLIENKKLDEFFWSSYELSTRAEIIYRWPELGLITLAALTPGDHEIKYIDEEIETIDFDEPFDLIGVTALTPKATRAYEIAAEFRKRNAFVVMGGPHASVLPEEALNYVDCVFVGEAQNVWGEFLNDYRLGKTKAVYGSTSRHADLKQSPIPRYDLLKADKYKIFPIETTRGCPHDCEFCSSTRLWGKKYRRKTVGQVIAEIETIKRVAPRKYLFFVDDNMFVNRKFSYQLMEAMIPCNLRWFTQTDISIAGDDKLLDLIYKAGCREVLIGFETLSPENMQLVDSVHWKLRQLKNYPSAIDKIQSRGISIYGSFILGMDHDDEGVFQRVRDFIFETKLLGFQILFLTPIPGTRVHRRLADEGRLFQGREWGNYSTYQLNFRLKHMTQEAFENGVLWLFQQVYSDKAFSLRKRHQLEIFKNLQRSN